MKKGLKPNLNAEKHRRILNRTLKSIRRRKQFERQSNILKNQRKKQKGKKRRSSGYERWFGLPSIKKVVVPQSLNLLTNTVQVLNFFEQCKKISPAIFDGIFFDFSKVEYIGNGAITILLSICGQLSDQGVNVSGNYPLNHEVRNTFEKSGFLRYFSASYSRKENLLSRSEIIKRGIDITNPEATAKKIRQATKAVWGEEIRNPKLQGMLIELMANTVNHAFKKDKLGWYLSVDNDSDISKVKFCFVDNGQGILTTIRLRFKDSLQKLIGENNDGTILEQAFDGKFGSRTRLKYRGRGLPMIKKIFEQNIIKRLFIISNSVCYDFTKKEYRILNTPFNGTFYYWELDQTCEKYSYGTKDKNS